jgi:hypothetical protein
VRTASVRIFRLTGTLETPGPIWEERLARPIDIHHAHRSRDDLEGGVQIDPDAFPFGAAFPAYRDRNRSARDRRRR